MTLRTCVALLALASTSSALMAARPESPSAAAEPIAWVVFVDDLHIDFRNTGRIRQLVQIFLNDIALEGDLVAIRTSGPSWVLTGFSSAREVLPDSKKLTGGALLPNDITGLILRDEKEVPFRASVALSHAAAAAALLSQVEPHRRAFVYVSNGHGFDMKTMIEARALVHVARTNGIRIFTLDAASMDRLPPNYVIADARTWEAYKAAARESLRVLAEQGGGVSVLDVQDARAALEQIRKNIRQ
jgi:hypothetical protein